MRGRRVTAGARAIALALNEVYIKHRENCKIGEWNALCEDTRMAEVLTRPIAILFSQELRKRPSRNDDL